MWTQKGRWRDDRPLNDRPGRHYARRHYALVTIGPRWHYALKHSAPVKVAERLKAELRENRIKAEKDKAAMGKAHRSEVKLWRKDLGEETKLRIKLEKQLEKHLNDSVATKSASSSLPPIPEPVSDKQWYKIHKMNYMAPQGLQSMTIWGGTNIINVFINISY